MKKICVAVLSLMIHLAAQDLRDLRGEIVSQSGADLSLLTVRLYRGGDVPEETHVERDGRFVFYGVRPGMYTLQVMDPAKNEILSEPVTVSSFTPPVTLQLPERRNDTPSGRTISAARLLHPPDRRSLREAAKAQKLAETGDHVRAVEELEKAVSLDPHYADAYNNLGAEYARLGRLKEAETAFRRAIEIDPTMAITQSNLAVVLAKMAHLDEAEQWARGALRLDASNADSRGILDSILAAEGKKTAR